MSLITYDISQLYNRTFGSKPVVPAASTVAGYDAPYYIGQPAEDNTVTARGRSLVQMYQGREVWLPVRLRGAFGQNSAVLNLPYSVIRGQCKKHIVSTPLAERQGTVKELYSVDDWQITVKGFLIGQNRQWPEAELEQLVKFFSISQALVIDNVLTDLLLENTSRPEEQCRVVIESLELPEMEGGRTRIQAFSMKLASDSVFTLEWKG